ncbi:MAG: phosphatase PAP2 family protein [Deltaproteobacteria bacterium]|nr:phosphatase PAP2 family protein [Deltaproteobacteria bacterium]
MTRFGRNIADAFTGWNIALHAGSIASTALLAATPADSKTNDFFQRHDPLGTAFGDTAFIVGLFWHLGIGLGIYVSGLTRADEETIGAGAAAIQAVGTTVLITTAQKFFSGRRAPIRTRCGLLCEGSFPRTTDSLDFRFDFWTSGFREGRFYWPSGHTATAFAFVSALAAYFPKRAWIRWAGYTVAALIGLGMISGASHWLSDVVAGAMIGHAIGWSTGRGFRAEFDYRFGEKPVRTEAPTGSVRWRIAPVALGEGAGIAVQFTH